MCNGGCTRQPMSGHWKMKEVEYKSKLVRAIRGALGLSLTKMVKDVFIEDVRKPTKYPPAPPLPRTN